MTSMGCDISKSYKIEINIENELGVFEPRDDVAGHVIIHTEEDTEINSCILWLYGLAKTQWNKRTENQQIHPGSLAAGLNLVRSTSNIPRIEDDNFGKVCSNAASVLSQVGSRIRNSPSKIYPTVFCCHENPCLPVTQTSIDSFKCVKNPRGMYKNRKNPVEWISNADSFMSFLDIGQSNMKTFDKTSHLFGESGSCPSLKNRYLRLCQDVWKNSFEPKTNDKQNFGDTQIIFKTKLNLLKHYYVSNKQQDREKSEDLQTTDSDTTVSLNDPNIQINSIPTNRSESKIFSDAAKSLNTLRTDGVSYSMDTMGEIRQINELTNKEKPFFILTRGIHVFDFEFQLPADLPSSFELPTDCLAGGALARIYYALRIEVCHHAAQVKHTQQREIIIFRPLELIHFPRLRDRVTLHKEFVLLGCCTSPSGIILCDLTTNKTGFVPGESIVPRIHITNRSSRAIQTVHLTFAQIVVMKGRDNQTHVEVLRLFAARMHPKPNLDGDRFRTDSETFSSSNSFYSQNSDDPLENRKLVFNKVQNLSHSESFTKPKYKGNGNNKKSMIPSVAVPAEGASAYFTDVIHVPPLPASGLLGRQKLIFIEYGLILRLRMQGDKEGKHDQRMQIPITIGSDPTRETSFTGSSEVVPCYASFNYASGEVIEYDPKHSQQKPSPKSRLTPVYRYFKPRPAEPIPIKPNQPTEICSDSHRINRQGSSKFPPFSPRRLGTMLRTKPTDQSISQFKHKDLYDKPRTKSSHLYYSKTLHDSRRNSYPYRFLDRPKSESSDLENSYCASPIRSQKLGLQKRSHHSLPTQGTSTYYASFQSDLRSPERLCLSKQRFYDDGGLFTVCDDNDSNVKTIPLFTRQKIDEVTHSIGSYVKSQTDSDSTEDSMPQHDNRMHIDSCSYRSSHISSHQYSPERCLTQNVSVEDKIRSKTIDTKGSDSLVDNRPKFWAYSEISSEENETLDLDNSIDLTANLMITRIRENSSAYSHYSSSEDEEEEEEEPEHDEEEGEDQQSGARGSYRYAIDKQMTNNSSSSQDSDRELKLLTKRYINQAETQATGTTPELSRMNHFNQEFLSYSSEDFQNSKARPLQAENYQVKSIHKAYWNRPRVAPVLGRQADTEGLWAVGRGPLTTVKLSQEIDKSSGNS